VGGAGSRAGAGAGSRSREGCWRTEEDLTRKEEVIVKAANGYGTVFVVAINRTITI
jgi:hypothetical protein